MSSTAGGSVVEETKRTRGLARKLTCSVVSIVVAGACLILLIQVVLTLNSKNEWGEDTKNRMIELEEENLAKLADAKAEFVSEQFGRIEEGVLQLQAFAGQVLLGAPETLVVDSYVASVSALDSSLDEPSFDFSYWYVPNLDMTDVAALDAVEGLLNRSALMDVTFRGMQRQHDLVYLAALEEPGSTGLNSQINFQGFPGAYQDTYETWGATGECEGYNYDELGFEPRCRPWYQDAIEAGNTGVKFTNPYQGVGTDELTITGTAPVFNPAGDLLGVVGLDIDGEGIRSWISDLTVIDDQGYAYLLAPWDGINPDELGQVAFHKNLESYDDPQYIFDLEEDLGEEEEAAFRAIIEEVVAECSGQVEYDMGGQKWILAWKHETVSGAGASGGDDCGEGGFIAVVTVGEDVLLEAFSETDEEVSRVVVIASLIMALVLLVLGCVTACIARVVAQGIVQPVNQLIDVVHALNKLDFSRQPAGTWMVNDTSSPEVEELMKAFESMSTVVKFANTTLASGDINAAELIYIEALTLFTKLENDRGVSIVNNNLGNVRTLQAGELAAAAATERNPAKARDLMDQAQNLYKDAATNYQLAINDADMLCAAKIQRNNGDSPLPGEEAKFNEHGAAAGKAPHGDVEAGSAAVTDIQDDDDSTSDKALYRQLANRKFNLALCLAAQGNSAVHLRGATDSAAIAKARKLMQESIQLTSSGGAGVDNSSDAKNDVRRFGYLLELAALERGQQGRSREAGQALDAAEEIVDRYAAVDPNGGPQAVVAKAMAAPLDPPVQILQQRLLNARADHCVSAGYPEAAIEHYTQALVGTGDKMDPSVARSSLIGLRSLASGDSSYGRHFPSDLLVALSLPPGAGKDPEALTSQIDIALERVEKETARTLPGTGGSAGKTDVDLCFVMDCTGSMQRWIDQARNKLLDIIAQAKEDVANISLRVAFVGYRDFGDRVQYERLDFHKEEDLPKLIKKLKTIRAYGGQDFPEDITGGLKLATDLSWRSSIRLCILIADAPCHGSMYHSGIGDNYPNGCPNKLDPSKLIYKLQYELGADFYFIRITQYTDKMMGVLKNTVSAMFDQEAKRRRSALQGAKKRDLATHDLGSDDNRFLEVVVESVKISIKQFFESY